MPDVILVLDMLEGYLQEGNPLYCGDDARKIIPNVRTLLDREMGRDARVFFLCDRHQPGDKELAMFPVHCIEGTKEAELIPELAGYPGEIVPMRRYSGFYGTGLDGVLRRIGPSKIIVCGVCTDIGVMYTVADARSRDYEVEVPADCVAAYDSEGHRFALKHMDRVLGAKLTRMPQTGVASA